MNAQPQNDQVPGSPGYVAPEAYRPIVDAQLLLIKAYLRTQGSK